MKNTRLWIRTAAIIVITLIGIYLVFGPRTTPTSSDLTWTGIKKNLSNNINLGLDLRGGSHLVMRVKSDDYLKTLTANNNQAAITAAQDAKLPVTDSTYVAEIGKYEITLNLSDPAQAPAVVEEVGKKVDNLGIWTQTTSGAAVTWSLPATQQATLKEQAVEQAFKIVESRINAFGVKEPTLQRHGRPQNGQILLQMPGVDDPERVKKLIGAESNLMLMKIAGDSFQTYPTREAAEQAAGGAASSNKRVYPYTERDDDADPAAKPDPNAEKKFVVVDYPAIIEGSELRDANAYSQTGSDYQISFKLKPAGAQKFGDWTGRNIGKYLAIVLNDEVKSAPVIRGQIFDSGNIEGKFTKTTAEDLALTLKSGALPAKIEYQEERTVGPSLGADSIEAGVEASLGGLIMIVLFMLFYYRGSGINAVIALLLNMLLTMAALVLIKSTLTLPGIAGLILGIGMAVDSNVLIFERIREELRAGKDVASAVSLGFERAFITIIDTHITTILSSVILYLYGSGPIRGFAVTLVLGLLINLFSAVFVSRTIFIWLLQRNPDMKKLSI